ncbi:MAG TPA: restriction endonuclease [Flavobacteriaceae bacterium]|nr:restriction endonuclease [Flavobacteriaceae bacterium]HIP12064.1 restriction endonuclease [Arcobacter sp.]
MNKSIIKYEHQKLIIGEDGFNKKHLNALLKLNEYHDFKYFEAIANGIKFNQYVGIIQIDGLSIEILPKADKYSDDDKWRTVLLEMLQECGKIKVSSAGAANVERQNLNLLEVYFELFLNEVNILIRQGLVKKYRKQSNNINALKGKLEFAGNIRKNLIHKERFYTTHQIYDKNHLLHQVLFVAIKIVNQFSSNMFLNDFSKRILLNFPEITHKTITKSTLDNIKLNRKTNAYSYAIELARLIILNYSPDISSGNEKMISLLFDMNNLWEEYVLIKLQKHFENTNYEVSGQERKNFFKSNYLIPDIVIRNNKETFIIDTKWKQPNNSANVSDLRQMYTYARFWNAKKVMLLYPKDYYFNEYSDFETDEIIELNDEYTKTKHQCKLGFVSVLNDENKLDVDIAKNIAKLIEVF